MHKENASAKNSPRFKLGQVVAHRWLGYSGVVVDMDLNYEGDGTWIDDEIPLFETHQSTPSNWYRVLIHDTSQEAYVPESMLTPVRDPLPIDHPEVHSFFDTFEHGHYTRTRNLN